MVYTLFIVLNRKKVRLNTFSLFLIKNCLHKSQVVGTDLKNRGEIFRKCCYATDHYLPTTCAVTPNKPINIFTSKLWLLTGTRRFSRNDFLVQVQTINYYTISNRIVVVFEKRVSIDIDNVIFCNFQSTVSFRSCRYF